MSRSASKGSMSTRRGRPPGPAPPLAEDLRTPGSFSTSSHLPPSSSSAWEEVQVRVQEVQVTVLVLGSILLT